MKEIRDDVFEHLKRDPESENMTIMEMKFFIKGWNACQRSIDVKATYYGLSVSQLLMMREFWLKHHRELPED